MTRSGVRQCGIRFAAIRIVDQSIPVVVLQVAVVAPIAEGPIQVHPQPGNEFGREQPGQRRIIHPVLIQIMRTRHELARVHHSVSIRIVKWLAIEHRFGELRHLCQECGILRGGHVRQSRFIFAYDGQPSLARFDPDAISKQIKDRRLRRLLAKQRAEVVRNGSVQLHQFVQVTVVVIIKCRSARHSICTKRKRIGVRQAAARHRQAERIGRHEPAVDGRHLLGGCDHVRVVLIIDVDRRVAERLRASGLNSQRIELPQLQRIEHIDDVPQPAGQHAGVGVERPQHPLQVGRRERRIVVLLQAAS